MPAGTLLVLDEPADIADAADFLWRQAQERRDELVAARDFPEQWPEAYLGPREWKSRLLRDRTLELTWESEAASPTGGGTPMGDLFGWREPALPRLGPRGWRRRSRAGRVKAIESCWRRIRLPAWPSC